MMKRFFICIAALLASVAISFAQTPEEIIERMDSEMKKADEMGLAITMDLTIPIIGKTSAAEPHGDVYQGRQGDPLDGQDHHVDLLFDE